MRAMDVTVIPGVAIVTLGGVAVGLWLLARGFAGYRTATRLGDTSTSPIGSLAAGEVRVSGVVEPSEVLLVSPLQDVPCVYYRATVGDAGEVAGPGPDIDEERAVGFHLRDTTGTIRVFPRDAHVDAPVRFDEADGTFGEPPPGLVLRDGPATIEGQPDRDAQIAALLSVRADGAAGGPFLGTHGADRQGRHYREARLEPGDAVTILGRATPFADLADPIEADVAILGGVTADDPEVAADLAEARSAGALADDAAAAWGNAAIPGFGIGRPVRQPELDPGADRAVLAPAGAERQAGRIFDIAPETLVLASTVDTPLLIAHGVPAEAVDRHHDRFLVGLLGAVLAIASATTFALMLSGGFGS
jgi:hypothetical protein